MSLRGHFLNLSKTKLLAAFSSPCELLDGRHIERKKIKHLFHKLASATQKNYPESLVKVFLIQEIKSC